MQPLPVGYITKVAISPAVLTNVGKFLTTTMPNAFKAIQSGAGKVGITAANAGAIRYGMPVAGGLVGGARGAMKAPEGQKGQGFVSGAISGAALGAGAGWAMNKLPAIGSKLTAEFAPAGQRLIDIAKTQPNISAKEFLDRGSKYVAKNFSEQWKPLPGPDPLRGDFFIGNKPPQMKTMWGTTSNAEAYRVGPGKSMLSKGLAETAKAVSASREHGVKGVFKALGQDIQDKRFFTQRLAGTTFRGKRSALGQVVNPLLASGVGMGILDAASVKNKDGSKPTVGKRLRKGTTSALGWGLAPPVMAGKLMYDTSKSFMGGHRPQQDLNNQGVE